MPTTLIFVRHGESRANNEKFFAGQLDVELSPLGSKQAEMTATYVASTYRIDKIYSSTLSRSYDTAKAISARTNIPIIPSDSLREINSGEWQGLHFDELQKKYAAEYGVWLSDIGKAQTPNGESVKELYERIWHAVGDIAEYNPDSTVVISTHATPIRAVICKLKGYSVDEMRNIPWGSNASVTIVTYDNGEWSLMLESYDEHLSDMKTKFPANV
jgi:probable phosphoglycerate mutase